MKHEIRQGECIDSIAFRYGFDPEYLWSIPENAHLRRRRNHHNALKPGDVLHLPELRLGEAEAGTETRTRFRRRKVPATFKVSFEIGGKPRRNEPVQVSVDGTDVGNLTTDGSGGIELPIPPDAEEVVVVFAHDKEKPQRYEFRLGGMDPLDTPSGQKARLLNLGLYLGEVDDEADEELSSALRRFQQQQGIDQTGTADSATLARLEELYGS